MKRIHSYTFVLLFVALCVAPAVGSQAQVQERTSHERTSILGGLAASAAVDTAAKAPAQKRKKLKRLNVLASDLAFSPTSQSLFVSVGTGSPMYADSLVEVTPKTGRVLRVIPIGHNPTRLAIADADRTAWVLLDGTALQRVDLASGQVVTEFTPAVPYTAEPTFPVAFAIMPGHPGTVAVSFGFRGHTGDAGTAIFDDGVMRPLALEQTTVGQLVFDGDVLWANTGGWNGSSSNMFAIAVRPDGLALEDDRVTYAGDYDVALINGRFYCRTGQIIDAASRKQIAYIPTGDFRFVNAHAVDADRNTAYFALDTGGFQLVYAVELAQYRVTGVFDGTAYNEPAGTTRLVDCGSAGLAAITGHFSEPGPVSFYPLKVFKPAAPYKRPAPVPENGRLRTISLPADFLIYDDVRKMMYASVTGGSPGIGNSVVEVDPFAGRIGRDVWLGSLPARLALTDDRRSLWVAMWGSREVKRLRLPDLTTDLTFDVERGDPGYGPFPSNAQEILPLPGQPDSVAVLRNWQPWFLEKLTEGVAIYDAGVRRPATAPETWQVPVDSVELDETGTMVYGLNNQTTGFEFTKLSVAPDGVHLGPISYQVGVAFFDELHYAGGLCYTDAGLIVDPTTGVRIGNVPFPDRFYKELRVVPDPAHGRIYKLLADDRALTLIAYESGSLQRVGSFTIDGFFDFPQNLMVWDDGRQLAFSNAGVIYLVPTALLK
jgi:hypothetical protein